MIGGSKMSIILVTGGSSGIGKEIVNHLGKHTVYAPTHEEMDVRSMVSVEKYTSKTSSNEVLINCAGWNYLEHIGKLEMLAVQKLLDTNVFGYINMINACKKNNPSLKRIINIGSIASRTPMRCSLAYNASKAAVDMITKQAARELAPEIVVFGVNPGKTYPSKMSEYVDERVPVLRSWTKLEALEYQINAIPIRRMGKGHDVAKLVSWLVEDAPDYMTGSIIEIAGGM